MAALFPWCALTQDASKAGRGVVAGMVVVGPSGASSGQFVGSPSADVPARPATVRALRLALRPWRGETYFTGRSAIQYVRTRSAMLFKATL